MIQRSGLYGMIEHQHSSPAHRAACPVCNPNKTVPELNHAFSRYMAVQLYCDRESFDTLKELLRKESTNNLGRTASEEPAAARRDREALKRVFDQIRNIEYSDR